MSSRRREVELGTLIGMQAQGHSPAWIAEELRGRPRVPVPRSNRPKERRPAG
jgi:hypothetical protein